MNLRKLLLAGPMLLLAGSAFAQFTSDQKDQVLGEMDQVLSKEAFVPGVDLAKWRTFLNERKDELDAADSPRTFTIVVNGALREFGLSHILLMRSRFRGGAEASSPLAAQRRFRQAPRQPEMTWIEDGAALVRVPDFENGYDEGAVAALMNQAKDAKYLVLDLRGNPGGELEKMRQFLGLVMPADAPIGTFVTRGMARDFGKDKGASSDPVAIAKWAHRELHPVAGSEAPFKGKIAVLVDGHSASAAEIVANTLRENNKSLVVGSQTAGAVLVSTFDRLSYGFSMQFPIGDYVSHEGHRLEGHPVTPDLAADGPDEAETALARLKAAG